MRPVGVSIIVGEFYKGQGLGNQLYIYASIRGLARLCDMDFAFIEIENFKGADLFDLEFGRASLTYPKVKYYERRLVDPVCGHDVAVTDATLLRQIRATREPMKVEGLLAATGYWPGGMAFLREILPLKAHVLAAADPAGRELVVHVRGGDFLSSNSTLGAAYYHAALNRLGMAPKDAAVITDDPGHARRLLGEDIQLVLNPGGHRHEMTADHHRGGSFVLDFIQLLRAQRIVLSNSSFAFWAAALNLVGARVVAPKYWAARDCGVHHWSPGDLFFQEFEYV